MQQEVTAPNNERARSAEQSRQAEAAARRARDVQEGKIKTLSGQMIELMFRLDQKSRYCARLEEENASLRAIRDQRIETINIGNPPGLSETQRDSSVPEKTVLPPTYIPPEGATFLPPST